MSIRPAQNKLVLQVVSDQTLFKIDFKLHRGIHQASASVFEKCIGQRISLIVIAI